jgi:hypothetical protein
LPVAHASKNFSPPLAHGYSIGPKSVTPAFNITDL